MTAPIGLTDDGVRIAELYPWARGNPTELGDPPKTFAALLTSDDRWRQTYANWLTGSTHHQPVATAVFQSEAKPLIATFRKMTAGGRETDMAKAVSALYEEHYHYFLSDVKWLGKDVRAHADRLRREARDRGETLGTSAARKAAGKEVGRAAFASVVLEQMGTLDLKVGLVAQLQIERYKSTALEMFLGVVAELQAIPWDEETDGKDRGYKKDAIAILTASVGPVLNACAAIQATVRQLEDIGDPGADPQIKAALTARAPQLTEQLFGDFAEFSDAIAVQGRAMTEAVRLVRAWAEWVTAERMREGWMTIHPRLSAAFTAMKMVCEIGAAVGGAVPGLHVTVLPLCAGLIEMVDFGMTEITVYAKKKDVANQAKYVGMEWKTKADLSTPSKVAEYLKAGLDRYDDIVGKPLELATKGVDFGVRTVAGKFTDKRHQQVDAGATAARVAEFIAQKQEYKTDWPSTLEGVIVMGVEALGEQAGGAVGGMTPFLSTVVHGKNVLQLGVNYWDAQLQELKQTVSDEDLAKLRSLITTRDSRRNPYYTLFDAGSATFRGAGTDVFVTVDGCELRVDLAAGRVFPADPKLVARRFVGAVRSKIGTSIGWKGVTWAIDWSGVADPDVRDAESMHLFVPGTTVVNKITYTGTLQVRYEWATEDARVWHVQSDKPIPENEVEGRLQAMLTTKAGADPVTPELLESVYVGQVVHWAGNGKDYTLKGPALLDPQSRPADGWLQFVMRTEGEPTHYVDLTYDADEGLRVLSVDATDASPANPKLAKVVDTSDVGKKLRAYSRVAPGEKTPDGAITDADLLAMLRATGNNPFPHQGHQYALDERVVNRQVDSLRQVIRFEVPAGRRGWVTFTYELDEPLVAHFESSLERDKRMLVSKGAIARMQKEAAELRRLEQLAAAATAHAVAVNVATGQVNP